MLRLLFLLSTICLSALVQAQNSPVTRPVVKVTAGPPGADELGAGFMTGELNGKLYIVTAYHVVKDFPDMIRIKLAGYPQVISAELDRQEHGLDLAVLSIRKPSGYAPPPSFAWSNSLPDLSDEVVVIGHPNGVEWDINRVVRLKATDVAGDYFDTQLTLYKNGLANGNSGGVVLSQDHKLIAMVQEVSSSQASCLRASVIQRVLKENGFPENLMVESFDQAPALNTDRYAGDMVWVEGGSFMMGSNEGDDDEKPVHRVTLEGFWMGKYEVTNEQFCVFLNTKGNQTEGGTTWLEIESSSCDITKSSSRFLPRSGKSNHPVREVSWYGAKAYAAWMATKTGHNYHLPTEAQWEYAARGGQNTLNTVYAGSNNVDEVAWYGSRRNSSPIPVGQKAANELGLHDMSGNVWEWCTDWYKSDYYNISPLSNPSGPLSGSDRVTRGGGWGNDLLGLRVTNRNSLPNKRRSGNVGFRLSRTL